MDMQHNSSKELMDQINEKSLIVQVTTKQRERISTIFSRDRLRLRQERNRQYEFRMNEACGDICQVALTDTESD
jgi:hypothetical protein